MSIRVLTICLLLVAGVAKVDAGFQGSAFLSLSNIQIKLTDVDNNVFGAAATGSFQGNSADLSLLSQTTSFGNEIIFDGAVVGETDGTQIIAGTTIVQIGDFTLGLADPVAVITPDGSGAASTSFSGSFVDLSSDSFTDILSNPLPTPTVGGAGTTSSSLNIDTSNITTASSGSELNSNTLSVSFQSGTTAALQLSGLYDLSLSLENVIPLLPEPINAVASSNFTVTLNANNTQTQTAYTASLDLTELNQSIDYGDAPLADNDQFDSTGRWVTGTGTVPIDSNGNLIIEEGFTYSLTLVQTSSVSFLPVPEPSTSLVMLTLLGCGAFSRRRRK